MTASRSRLTEKQRKMLRVYYPPSVTAALEMWFEKHPGKWPFQCPDDIHYWSQCIEATRKRYNYGNHLKNEIMWYYRNGLLIPPEIVQEFEALAEESLALTDWSGQESL